MYMFLCSVCCLRILAVECKIQTAEFISLEGLDNIHKRILSIVQAPNRSDAFNFRKIILGHLSSSSSM